MPTIHQLLINPFSFWKSNTMEYRHKLFYKHFTNCWCNILYVNFLMTKIPHKILTNSNYKNKNKNKEPQASLPPSLPPYCLSLPPIPNLQKCDCTIPKPTASSCPCLHSTIHRHTPSPHKTLNSLLEPPWPWCWQQQGLYFVSILKFVFLFT